MKSMQKDVTFKEINKMCKKVLPIFGAHPLSNIFNEMPIFLVEGEDEERIWQQAIRTSEGCLKLYPCSVGGKSELRKYEYFVDEVIRSVYDNATAYSLVDHDDGDNNLNTSFEKLKSFKLDCRASENLMLSDEILVELNTSWDVLKNKIENWLNEENKKVPGFRHQNFVEMQSFKNSFNRKEFNLKKK